MFLVLLEVINYIQPTHKKIGLVFIKLNDKYDKSYLAQLFFKKEFFFQKYIAKEKKVFPLYFPSNYLYFFILNDIFFITYPNHFVF